MQLGDVILSVAQQWSDDRARDRARAERLEEIRDGREFQKEMLRLQNEEQLKMHAALKELDLKAIAAQEAERLRVMRMLAPEELRVLAIKAGVTGDIDNMTPAQLVEATNAKARERDVADALSKATAQLGAMQATAGGRRALEAGDAEAAHATNTKLAQGDRDTAANNYFAAYHEFKNATKALESMDPGGQMSAEMDRAAQEAVATLKRNGVNTDDELNAQLVMDAIRDRQMMVARQKDAKYASAFAAVQAASSKTRDAYQNALRLGANVSSPIDVATKEDPETAAPSLGGDVFGADEAAPTPSAAAPSPSPGPEQTDRYAGYSYGGKATQRRATPLADTMPVERESWWKRTFGGPSNGVAAPRMVDPKTTQPWSPTSYWDGMRNTYPNDPEVQVKRAPGGAFYSPM